MARINWSGCNKSGPRKEDLVDQRQDREAHKIPQIAMAITKVACDITMSGYTWSASVYTML